MHLKCRKFQQIQKYDAECVANDTNFRFTTTRAQGARERGWNTARPQALTGRWSGWVCRQGGYPSPPGRSAPHGPQKYLRLRNTSLHTSPSEPLPGRKHIQCPNPAATSGALTHMLCVAEPLIQRSSLKAGVKRRLPWTVAATGDAEGLYGTERTRRPLRKGQKIAHQKSAHQKSHKMLPWKFPGARDMAALKIAAREMTANGSALGICTEIVKRGGRVLLTEILLPRIARRASNCLIGGCLSNCNERISSKKYIEKLELDEGFQQYHPPFRIKDLAVLRVWGRGWKQM